MPSQPGQLVPPGPSVSMEQMMGMLATLRADIRGDIADAIKPIEDRLERVERKVSGLSTAMSMRATNAALHSLDKPLVALVNYPHIRNQAELGLLPADQARQALLDNGVQVPEGLTDDDVRVLLWSQLGPCVGRF